MMRTGCFRATFSSVRAIHSSFSDKKSSPCCHEQAAGIDSLTTAGGLTDTDIRLALRDLSAVISPNRGCFIIFFIFKLGNR